ELTDVGYNHIPKGANRDIKIARAMQTRQVGTKLPPPYPNGWFALAESRDLKIGGVVSVDALGQNFAVYRGEDGVARCVDAYCPHLGANLGVGGTVSGGCIECPFHKWRFDDGGACPSLERREPEEEEELKGWVTGEERVWWGQHTWAAEWLRGEGHTARINLTHRYKFGKLSVFQINIVADQNGPGHVRLRLETGFGPVLISQSVTPIGVLQQRVVHRIYSPWYNAVIAAAFVPGESYMELPDVGFNHIPKGANRDIKVARALQTRQELTDVGYNHIPKGANRDIKIARAMQTRQVGTKLPPPYPNGWFALAESRDLKIGGVVSVDALAPKGISIKTWQTVEAEGAIWVWYDAEGRSPLWSVVSPEEEEELKGWGYRGRNEFVVGSHIMNGPGHVRLRLETGFGPVLISQSVTPIGVLQQRVCTGYTSPWYNAVIAAAFCAWRELYVRTGHGYMEQ
ncbi:hypothetical protein MSG28_016231, partial [Choristoneura fumiferana]